MPSLLRGRFRPRKTVRVDISSAKAIPFRPTISLYGSSPTYSPPKTSRKGLHSGNYQRSRSPLDRGPQTTATTIRTHHRRWHWNPQGSWSGRRQQSGYFTANAEPTETLRMPTATLFRIAANTVTRRLAWLLPLKPPDGDPRYWKSNPYLAAKFTGESDALHHQGIVIDLARATAMQCASPGQSYPQNYARSHWLGSDDCHE